MCITKTIYTFYRKNPHTRITSASFASLKEKIGGAIFNLRTKINALHTLRIEIIERRNTARTKYYSRPFFIRLFIQRPEYCEDFSDVQVMIRDCEDQYEQLVRLNEFITAFTPAQIQIPHSTMFMISTWAPPAKSGF